MWSSPIPASKAVHFMVIHTHKHRWANAQCSVAHKRAQPHPRLRATRRWPHVLCSLEAQLQALIW